MDTEDQLALLEEVEPNGDVGFQIRKHALQVRLNDEMIDAEIEAAAKKTAAKKAAIREEKKKPTKRRTPLSHFAIHF